MYRIFVAFILLLCVSSLADSDRVAVVVNKRIITEREIFNRKNFIIKLQNLSSLGQKEHEYLKEVAKQTLIDEILLEEDAVKHGIKPADNDINQFIINVEKSRNFKEGHFKSMFSKNTDLYQTFYAKMKGEYVKSRISNEVFIRQINVSESEIDDLAVNYGKKDLEIDLREFSINDKNDKSYLVLKKLQKSAKNCDSKIKESGVKVARYTKKLSELHKDEREVIDSINSGKFSVINENESGIRMFQVCSRKVSSLTGDEIDNISSMIGNKRLTLKFMKYMETLRKRAYIRIM